MTLSISEANRRMLKAYDSQGSYLPDVPICPDLGIAAAEMIRAEEPMEPAGLARWPYSTEVDALQGDGRDLALWYRPESLPLSDDDRRRKLGVVTVGLLTAIDQLALGPDGGRLPDEIPMLLPDDEPMRRSIAWLGVPGNALLYERALQFASRAIYRSVGSGPQVASYRNDIEGIVCRFDHVDFESQPALLDELNSLLNGKRTDIARHLRSVVTRELEMAALPALTSNGLPLSQHQLFVLAHNLTRPLAAPEWDTAALPAYAPLSSSL